MHHSLRTTARLWDSPSHCAVFRVTSSVAIIAWLAVLLDLTTHVDIPMKRYDFVMAVALASTVAAVVVCALHSYEQLMRRLAQTSYAQGREDKYELHLVRPED